jgi:hypothetical protein
MRSLKLRVSGLYRAGEHVFPSGQLPLVQLAGDWLAAAGFPVGARVAVEAVEDGRLVLTRVDEAAEEPARWPERWVLTQKGAEALREEREGVAVRGLLAYARLPRLISALLLPLGLLENGVEHLGDEALLASGELGELLELSLELGGGSALGRLLLGGAEELLDGDAEGLGELGQGGDGDATPALLEGEHLLLGVAEDLGELDLSEAALVA